MTELFNVVTPQEAVSRLHRHLSPSLKAERIDVRHALDRVTASDVRSPTDLPAFPRSTMDGFAVLASSTYGATEGLPVYLKMTGEAPMGRAPTIAVGPGEAVRVHTGGMLPQGADAVVMVENTQEVDPSTIEVVKPVAPGENVLRAGDDVRKGDMLLAAGHWLRPQDLGGMMGLGITRVDVAVKPRVALISTGDEVVAPEATPQPGQVRDINTYALSALAAQAGGIPVFYGIVKDEPDKLEEAARKALADSDLLVISAGSSVSTRDATARVIATLGKPGVLVHGVSVRPGKPTILAVVDGKPVVGLPGNPVSAMVTFELFVTPTIYLLLGCKQPPARYNVRARLTRNVASTTGREDYVQVRLEERDGELWAAPIFGESNLITTMVRAEGMAKIPLDLHGMTAGEWVSVRLF